MLASLLPPFLVKDTGTLAPGAHLMRTPPTLCMPRPLYQERNSCGCWTTPYPTMHFTSAVHTAKCSRSSPVGTCVTLERRRRHGSTAFQMFDSTSGCCEAPGRLRASQKHSREKSPGGQPAPPTLSDVRYGSFMCPGRTCPTPPTIPFSCLLWLFRSCRESRLKS